MRNAIAALGLLLGFSLCTGLTAHAAGDKDKKYGKRIVAEYDLPADVIQKIASFKPSAPQKGESMVVNMAGADAVPWNGPSFKANSSTNPYVIVIRVKGKALEAGDASTMWQAGWRLDDSTTRMSVVPGLSKSGARAGEALTLTAAAAPVSFKEDREVGAYVGLVNARNLAIESVHVQVWSGLASASIWETILSVQGLLVGLVFLGLAWWFKR